MKILLVVPNTPPKEKISKYVPFTNDNSDPQLEPPIGTFYIAAVLDKAGHDVELIDNFTKKIPNEKLIKIIKEKKPDILGLCLYITNYTPAKEILKEIKKSGLNIKTVIGGPYSTINPDFVNDEDVDFLVYGEGEYTMLELAEKIAKNEINGQRILGCIYKKNREIIKGSPRPFIKDLDKLPYPAWHLVDINDYYRKKTIYLDVEPVDLIATSRGCPYDCTFCSANLLWHRKYRYRTPENVCDEIEFMQKKYGTKGVVFREDNFTVNNKRVYEFCKEIKKRNLKIFWQCESRVDTLNDELLKEMYSAGCRGMWFGIESGSQEILDKMKKGIKLEQVRKAIYLCKKNNIKVGGSFMFGLPIETKKDIRKTFEFAKSLKLDNTIFGRYIGYPGSELNDYTIKNNLYKEVWEGIYIVETPELKADEMLSMAKYFQEYFRFRKINRIFKMRKLKDYPHIFIRGIESFKNLVSHKPRI